MIGINGRLGWSVVALAIVFAGGAWATRRAAVPGSPGPRPALVSRLQVPPPGVRPAGRGTVVHDGIRVELQITPVASPDAPADGPLLEGQDVRVAFAISDTAGGLPLAKVYPSAWVVPRRPDARPTTPRDALLRATLINGGLFNRPELDLNIYYAVTLNHNATITVVDPLFGFGGTKLLALVPLAARGDDWAWGRAAARSSSPCPTPIKWPSSIPRHGR